MNGLAVLAGSLSTFIFAASFLPMVVRAARTRDLHSYSAGNLVLTNLGNALHSFYIYQLPAGPIWVLHTFYLLTSAFMLVWFVRFRSGAGEPAARHPGQEAVADRERVPARR